MIPYGCNTTVLRIRLGRPTPPAGRGQAAGQAKAAGPHGIRRSRAGPHGLDGPPGMIMLAIDLAARNCRCGLLGASPLRVIRALSDAEICLKARRPPRVVRARPRTGRGQL